MDKRVFKITVGVFIFLLLTGGIYVLWQVFGAEVIYQAEKDGFMRISEEIKDAVRAGTDDKDGFTIPEGNRLIIPSIGVDAELGADIGSLDIGGWMQVVDEENNPKVIAIHRFGWDFLSPKQKMKQTLYHVDKLEVGDEVVVSWDGQVYQYEIVDIYERRKLPELGNNEIAIYTCNFFNANKRVFVKGELSKKNQ